MKTKFTPVLSHFGVISHTTGLWTVAPVKTDAVPYAILRKHCSKPVLIYFIVNPFNYLIIK